MLFPYVTITYLAHVAHAVIIVDGAVFAAEAKCALTRIVVALINAGCAVFARIKFLCTELDLLLAKRT